MIPEEQEALRKKEERRDRLHKNYLRRKANGKQKQYDDKIKVAKKAEIEARKAALRVEDMAKGVFVSASVLPKTEPQKLVPATMASATVKHTPCLFVKSSSNHEATLKTFLYHFHPPFMTIAHFLASVYSILFI